MERNGIRRILLPGTVRPNGDTDTRQVRQRSRKVVSLIRPSTIFRFSSTFSLLSTPQNRFYSLCAAAFKHAISRQITLNQQLRPKCDIWNRGLDFANFRLGRVYPSQHHPSNPLRWRNPQSDTPHLVENFHRPCNQAEPVHFQKDADHTNHDQS